MLLAVGVTSQAIVPSFGPHLSSERKRREASEAPGQPGVFYSESNGLRDFRTDSRTIFGATAFQLIA